MIRHNNIRHFDTTYCHRANNEHQRFILSSALVSSKHTPWVCGSLKHVIINDSTSNMTVLFRLIFLLVVTARNTVVESVYVFVRFSAQNPYRRFVCVDKISSLGNIFNHVEGEKYRH